MRAETISTIKMLVTADPETTPEQAESIMRACTTSRRIARDLISSSAARQIIGVSKVTLCKWVKAGRLKPVRISRRIYRYDRNEIENLAYCGQGQK